MAPSEASSTSSSISSPPQRASLAPKYSQLPSEARETKCPAPFPASTRTSSPRAASFPGFAGLPFESAGIIRTALVTRRARSVGSRRPACRRARALRGGRRLRPAPAAAPAAHDADDDLPEILDRPAGAALVEPGNVGRGLAAGGVRPALGGEGVARDAPQGVPAPPLLALAAVGHVCRREVGLVLPLDDAEAPRFRRSRVRLLGEVVPQVARHAQVVGVLQHHSAEGGV